MVVTLLATWIPALLIGLSGVMKLMGNQQILETMTVLGVRRYVPYSAPWNWHSRRCS